MMNAFRNTLQRSATQAGRRFASASALPKPPVPAVYNKSFQTTWLSDPSTYPLICIMTTATCFVFGAMTHSMMYYKDIRINPKHKHETIQSWGEEPVRSVVSVVVEEPKGFHRQAFKDIRKEGLGVDHNEWKKTKDAYYSSA